MTNSVSSSFQLYSLRANHPQISPHSPTPPSNPSPFLSCPVSRRSLSESRRPGNTATQTSYLTRFTLPPVRGRFTSLRPVSVVFGASRPPLTWAKTGKHESRPREPEPDALSEPADPGDDVPPPARKAAPLNAPGSARNPQGPNPLLPRAFAGKGADGMKKRFPST
jgi:hypothetical protein